MHSVKLNVKNIYSDTARVFEGDELDIRAQLMDAYPWLASYNHETLQDDILSLNRLQSLIVKVEEW